MAKSFNSFALAALALSLFSIRPGHAATLQPGSYTERVTLGSSIERKFLIHVPKKYNGETLPVVIVLHGGLSNAKMSQWNARMVEKGDQDKFFVVYPYGSHGIGSHLLTWNAGTCCGLAGKKKADDVEFIRELIVRLKKEYTIDGDKVFVTGMSNGGMMAYRVACELSDLVAAVAPVDGCMLSNKIVSKEPISVFAIYGKSDHVVRYDGGTGSFLGYKISCPSVADSAKTWVEHDNCQPEPIRKVIGDVLEERYQNGRSGTEVCVCTVNAGHMWPGGRVKVPFQKTSNFSATNEMCDFFWKHPKRHDDRLPPKGTTEGPQ